MACRCMSLEPDYTTLSLGAYEPMSQRAYEPTSLHYWHTLSLSQKGQGVQEEQVVEDGQDLGQAAWAGVEGEGLPALCDSKNEDSEEEEVDSDSDDNVYSEEVQDLPGPGGDISDSEEEAPVLEDMAGEYSTAGSQEATTGQQQDAKSREVAEGPTSRKGGR